MVVNGFGLLFQSLQGESFRLYSTALSVRPVIIASASAITSGSVLGNRAIIKILSKTFKKSIIFSHRPVRGTLTQKEL